jgi:hypothetical protein
MDICHLNLKFDVIQCFVSQDKSKLYYRSYDRLVVINVEPTKEAFYIIDDVFIEVIKMQYLGQLDLFIIHKINELIMFNPSTLLFTDLPVYGNIYDFKISPDNKYIFVEIFGDDDYLEQNKFQLYHNCKLVESKINNIANVKNIDNEGNLYYIDDKNIIKYNAHTGNKLSFDCDILLSSFSRNSYFDIKWQLTTDCKYILGCVGSTIFTVNANNMELIKNKQINNDTNIKILDAGYFIGYYYYNINLYESETLELVFEFCNDRLIMRDISIQNNLIIIENPNDVLVIYDISQPNEKYTVKAIGSGKHSKGLIVCNQYIFVVLQNYIAKFNISYIRCKEQIASLLHSYNDNSVTKFFQSWAFDKNVIGIIYSFLPK